MVLFNPGTNSLFLKVKDTGANVLMASVCGTLQGDNR